MENKIIEPKININEILNLIPHRYPFLLVDRILEIEEKKSIIGLKNITINEPQFMGHFPSNPVMPGVLMIEALAQISAVLVSYDENANIAEKQVFFMSIDFAKFRKVVTPGDTLILKSRITQNKGNIWKFSSLAEVNGQVAVECDHMAMVKNKE